MSEDGYRNMQDETKSKAIKATIIVVFVVFVVWFLWPTDQWLGFVYPNSSSLSNYNEIGPFDSLESCQTNAQIVLEVGGWTGTGTYECGLNCGMDSGYGMYVCEVTSK